MANLIERYLYDVTRRLPEKSREDVSRELRANIYDMLPEDADEGEIREVLQQLGAPSTLAEQYRQKPRYLISPAVYDDYIRVIRWLVPLIGVILLVLGLVLGAIDAISGEELVTGEIFFKSMISRGMGMGLSGALQAVVWTTVGFAIADRTGVRFAEQWTPDELPEELPPDKDSIPLVDSVVELIITVVGTFVAALFLTGAFPIAVSLTHNGVAVELFSSEFLAACIPALAALAVFETLEHLAKIAQRRWTPLVCAAVIANNLVNIAVLIYLVRIPAIFSSEFQGIIESQAWLSNLLRINGSPVGSPLAILAALIIAGSILSCFHAAYRTYKAKVSLDKGHSVRM